MKVNCWSVCTSCYAGGYTIYVEKYALRGFSIVRGASGNEAPLHPHAHSEKTYALSVDNLTTSLATTLMLRHGKPRPEHLNSPAIPSSEHSDEIPFIYSNEIRANCACSSEMALRTRSNHEK